MRSFTLELEENEFITRYMGDMVIHAIETLRAKGLRVTEQRKAILEALACRLAQVSRGNLFRLAGGQL